MADKTGIEWTDATWQIVTGCTVLSPGCKNCYAMGLAGGRLQHHPSRAGLTEPSKAGPVWNGQVRFNADWLRQPIKWTKPRDIFVAAHGDLFHEGVETWMLVKVFAVMAIADQHRFQVLTKRTERMAKFCQWLETEHGRATLDEAVRELGHVNIKGGKREPIALPLPNVWLGTSVEDQERANERIPFLIDTPAAVRWISAEPLLGPIDLTNLDHTGMQKALGAHGISAIWKNNAIGRPWLDWVVVGGESGPRARPMHPDWARSLRDQCAENQVAFFFKQNGSWICQHDRDRDDPGNVDANRIAQLPNSQWLNLAGGQGFHGSRVVRMFRVGKKIAGDELDGRRHQEMPGA